MKVFLEWVKFLGQLFSTQSAPKNLFMVGAFFFVSIGLSFSAMLTLTDKSFLAYKDLKDFESIINQPVNFDRKTPEQCKQYQIEVQKQCTVAKFEIEEIDYLENLILRYSKLASFVSFLFFGLSLWSYLTQLNTQQPLDNTNANFFALALLSFSIVIFLLSLASIYLFNI